MCVCEFNKIILHLKGNTKYQFTSLISYRFTLVVIIHSKQVTEIVLLSSLQIYILDTNTKEKKAYHKSSITRQTDWRRRLLFIVILPIYKDEILSLKYYYYYYYYIRCCNTIWSLPFLKVSSRFSIFCMAPTFLYFRIIISSITLSIHLIFVLFYFVAIMT